MSVVMRICRQLGERKGIVMLCVKKVCRGQQDGDVYMSIEGDVLVEFMETGVNEWC